MGESEVSIRYIVQARVTWIFSIRTEKPGMLQSLGLKELNSTDWQKMNSDILGSLNSTDQWYDSPQDCARSWRPMMREQASLDIFWWIYFFFSPTDFSVTRDVLSDSSAIACFSRMSQLSLQKQENTHVCPCAFRSQCYFMLFSGWLPCLSW